MLPSPFCACEVIYFVLSNLCSISRTLFLNLNTYTFSIAIMFAIQLLYLARDWPDGYTALRDRTRRAFLINREETDPRKIEHLLGRAEYVIKEIEALYRLKKYRTLKKRYYK